MDGDITRQASLIIAGTALVGLFWLLISMWFPSQAGRDKELEQLLEGAEVVADDHIRDRLAVHLRRRQTWGAVGGAIGSGVLLGLALLSAALSDSRTGSGFFGVLCMVGGVFGSAVGQALTARASLSAGRHGVRVSALQPHGMTDYLHVRQIGLEIGLALLGWLSVAVWVSRLAGVVNLPVDNSTAVGLALVGGLLAVPPSAALLLQSRLLAAPRPAHDRGELIVADITLARGLSDLYFTGISAIGPAVVVVALLPGRPWWLVGAYAAIYFSTLLLGYSVRGRLNPAPVARRLSAEQQAA